MTSTIRVTASAKLIAIGVLLSCCAAAQNKPANDNSLCACGPDKVKFKVHTEKHQHPTPPPESEKALVYLAGDSTFAIDGQWVGASNPATYFYLSLDPGTHHFCARFSHLVPGFAGLFFLPERIKGYSVHSLDAKAGETYYFGLRGYPYPSYGTAFLPPFFLVTMLQSAPEPATRAAPVELVQYDADEEARVVAESRFSTSRQK
jgi:hypothetical protein